MAKPSKETEEMINTAYSSIISLNEPLDLNVVHSDIWNVYFKSLCTLAENIARNTWPKIKAFNLADYTEKSEDIYEPDDQLLVTMNYEKTVLKILKKYDPTKETTNKKTGETSSSTFFGYFMLILRNDLFYYNQKVKTELANQNRVFKISERNQRKINKLLHILYLKHAENENIKIDLNTSESKKIFLEEFKNNNFNLQKMFKSEADIDKIISLNLLAYGYDNSKRDILENQGDKKSDNTFSKTVFTLETAVLLQVFFKLVDKNYLYVINRKKQNDTDQRFKELFEQEIITCYYLNSLQKKIPNLDIQELINYIRNKKFASYRIITKFQQKEIDIQNTISKHSIESQTELKQLIRIAPASLESISKDHGKPKNYGTRRITDFRKSLLTLIEASDEKENLLKIY